MAPNTFTMSSPPALAGAANASAPTNATTDSAVDVVLITYDLMFFICFALLFNLYIQYSTNTAFVNRNRPV